jgi:hypothetical protein
MDNDNSQEEEDEVEMSGYTRVQLYGDLGPHLEALTGRTKVKRFLIVATPGHDLDEFLAKPVIAERQGRVFRLTPFAAVVEFMEQQLVSAITSQFATDKTELRALPQKLTTEQILELVGYKLPGEQRKKALGYSWRGTLMA